MEARAAELLHMERNLVGARADCDSGGYPSVLVGIESSQQIIRRMTKFGTAVEIRNTECLKYLGPSECDRLWRYTPDSSDGTYIVSHPSAGRGEFVISVDRV